MQIDDVTGDMGLERLVERKVLVRLDDTCAYPASYAGTLYGRASIAEQMVPFGAAATGPLALWVWQGGRFPGRVDVVSGSHFRARVHGRQIVVHNRRTPPEQLMRLRQLLVTSPMRTACDLACMDLPGQRPSHTEALIARMLDSYGIKVSQCLKTLWENPRWPNHGPAVRMLMNVEKRMLLDRQRQELSEAERTERLTDTNDETGIDIDTVVDIDIKKGDGMINDTADVETGGAVGGSGFDGMGDDAERIR
ncbi:hypothetical protein [Bifidobacterium simiarum]|uniref:hypothetical protein n=1 Tax=Bifidobacterium simiarum TaxID=2045441 RepID=UPI001BDCE9D6|nr:hypothetical protein [Bifidobacterium simiarum]MBT1166998.1 hypothetical protein [Bifidobacterium simiarum]